MAHWLGGGAKAEGGHGRLGEAGVGEVRRCGAGIGQGSTNDWSPV